MNKKLAAGVALSVVGGIFVAGACIYDDEPATPQPMIPAAGPVLSPSAAVMVLTEAQCNRAIRCGQIGPNAAFADRQTCLQVMSRDLSANLASCRYGVKDRAVRACAAEVDRSACGPVVNPFHWYSQLVSCRTANLCLQ